MKLEKELKLKVPALGSNHEALLSLVRTSSMIMKLSDRFFLRHGITDTQFNILMTLKQYDPDGLSQRELSERLIVTKSNVTGLIDRLEKAGYVARKSKVGDRRLNRIVPTLKGRRLIEKVQGPYFREVDKLMNILGSSEKKMLIDSTAKLRQYVSIASAGGRA